jgi:hypothetical protein
MARCCRGEGRTWKVIADEQEIGHRSMKTARNRICRKHGLAELSCPDTGWSPPADGVSAIGSVG